MTPHNKPITRLEPGAWRDAGLENPITGLPPNCPVVPLGKSEDRCGFLNTQGAIETMRACRSGRAAIGSIFVGHEQYLKWAWPQWRKLKGGGRIVVNWDADQARQALFAACAYVGVFDELHLVSGPRPQRAEVADP